MKTVAVIGAGPAGLRAAEVARAEGLKVIVFDAKPSAGRKFLVAGRGGLNLTKDEDAGTFLSAYEGPDMPGDVWSEIIADFDPRALRSWAADLGVETFAASTGRVYPRALKGAPLLRAWIHRLKSARVEFAMHHRLVGIDTTGAVEFSTPAGQRRIRADATVLALGGASWPQTGSDGRWVEILARAGVGVAPLVAANCGWEVAWPPAVLAAAEGLPIKNVSVSAGTRQVRGELVVTRYGLEGGAIYALGSALRTMETPRLEIDFKPDVEASQLVRKLGPVRRAVLAEAAARWRLGPAATAVLTHLATPTMASGAAELAAAAKAFPIPLVRPRPIAEAISSAGGIRWTGLDRNLMLARLPGIFCAGEMIDWEAPTGGYLLQACFATGTRAGHAAANWALRRPCPET